MHCYSVFVSVYLSNHQISESFVADYPYSILILYELLWTKILYSFTQIYTHIHTHIYTHTHTHTHIHTQTLHTYTHTTHIHTHIHTHTHTYFWLEQFIFSTTLNN